jgi:GNAT superfamily N-acetyltransferase
MADDLHIAPLDPAEIESVGPLWRHLMDHIAALPDAAVPVRPSDESWELERAEMLEELAGESFVLAASRGGRVAGYAFVCVEAKPDPVWYTGDRHALLATLVVDEAERGDGVGSALMDAVDEELARRGIEDVEIGVDTGNAVATRLYESRGYRPDFRIFYGSPGRRPWACLRREAEDKAAGRGRFAPPGPDGPAPGSAGPEEAAAGPVDIARVDPARLDELRPLWEALLVRHAQLWSVLPERPAGETWRRRRRQYEGWLRDDGSFALIARRDGKGVGYILVGVGEGDETYATGERMAEIRTLVVAAGERDAGVGGQLFDAAMEELRRCGVDDLLVGHMDGNEAARRFCERRGFVPFVHLLYARRPGAGPTADAGAGGAES